MAVLQYTWVLIFLSFISDEIFSKNVGRNDEHQDGPPVLLALRNNGMSDISKIQNGFQNNRGPEYHSGSLELSKISFAGK